MKDNIIKCNHCGSPFCYENTEKDFTSWSCYTCGFSSNSYMIKDSEQVISFEETLPELFKDIRFIDKSGYVWYPIVVNDPNRGIIFPNGTSADNWQWSFAPSVIIPEMERFKYPDPKRKGENMTHRIDMSKVQTFKRNEFRKAVEAAGIV